MPTISFLALGTFALLFRAASIPLFVPVLHRAVLQQPVQKLSLGRQLVGIYRVTVDSERRTHVAVPQKR